MKFNSLQQQVITEALIRHKDLVYKVNNQINIPSYPNEYLDTLKNLINQFKDAS